MPDLCTVEEALLQIRGDQEADGPWLGMWIPVVSEAVLRWVKDEWRLYTPTLDSNGQPAVDSNGEWIPEEDSNGPVINPLVRAAALLELSSQYRFREGEGDNRMETIGQGTYGYTLSRGATALLTGIRRPTVA